MKKEITDKIKTPTAIASVCTALLVMVAVVGYFFSGTTQDKSNIGQYISGVTSSIALIWLFMGYFQQGKTIKLQKEELILQRNELVLQRNEMARQANEMKRMSKLTTLAHIRTMVNDTVESIKNCAPHITDVSTLASSGIVNQYFKVILESTDAKEVYSNFFEWSKGYSAAQKVLRCAKIATIMYFSIDDETFNASDALEPEWFAELHIDKIRSIPHLYEISATIQMLSSFITRAQPGIDAVNLAFYVSSVDVLGKDMLKDNVITDLVEKINKEKKFFPAIYKKKYGEEQ